MTVNCDKCGGPTSPKEFKYKDTSRGTFTKYVCNGNCMDGRFKHSLFAPKVPNTTAPVQNGNGQKGNEALAVLKSIDTNLKNILQILQTKSKTVPIQQEELDADENVPF